MTLNQNQVRTVPGRKFTGKLYPEHRCKVFIHTPPSRLPCLDPERPGSPMRPRKKQEGGEVLALCSGEEAAMTSGVALRGSSQGCSPEWRVHSTMLPHVSSASFPSSPHLYPPTGFNLPKETSTPKLCPRLHFYRTWVKTMTELG
jgi:hypothetical protein